MRKSQLEAIVLAGKIDLTGQAGGKGHFWTKEELHLVTDGQVMTLLKHRWPTGVQRAPVISS